MVGARRMKSTVLNNKRFRDSQEHRSHMIILDSFISPYLLPNSGAHLGANEFEQ